MDNSHRLLTLNLLKMHCYLSKEKKHDDIYLVYGDEKIWPEQDKKINMSSDHDKEINVEVRNLREGMDVTIEMWNWDLFAWDSLIGTFHIPIEGVGGPFQTDINQNEKDTSGVRYTLDWELY